MWPSGRLPPGLPGGIYKCEKISYVKAIRIKKLTFLLAYDKLPKVLEYFEFI